MVILETIPTVFVHDPVSGHLCRINENDVPAYRAKGFILGTAEDETQRLRNAKFIDDALADKAKADQVKKK